MNFDWGPWGGNRARVGWWLFVLALGAVSLFVTYSFVGTFVFGLFVYYGTRPIYQRLRPYLWSDDAAAWFTLLGVTVPIFLLVAYVVVSGLRDFGALTGVTPNRYVELLSPVIREEALSARQRDLVSSLLRNPTSIVTLSADRVRSLLTTGLSALGTLSTGLLHVALAFTLAFYLLRDDDRVAGWFRTNVARSDSAAHSYATAVDSDLGTVFFGNVLFMFAVAVIAVAVYNGFNYLAPSALTIPFPTLLAVLTGVTSLIPIVVGKLVYVPAVLYVGAVAVRTPQVGLFFPVALLVTSFLLLDILPQTFLQPYISGRKIHTGLMLFAYLLGPLLFGWYGFFLLPLLFVLIVEAVRIPLTELLHGDPLTPAVSAARSLGSDTDGTAEAEDG